MHLYWSQSKNTNCSALDPCKLYKHVQLANNSFQPIQNGTMSTGHFGTVCVIVSVTRLGDPAHTHSGMIHSDDDNDDDDAVQYSRCKPWHS